MVFPKGEFLGYLKSNKYRRTQEPFFLSFWTGLDGLSDQQGIVQRISIELIFALSFVFLCTQVQILPNAGLVFLCTQVQILPNAKGLFFDIVVSL